MQHREQVHIRLAGCERGMEVKMSKYEALWNYIQENGGERLKLTYAEIEKIAGVPIDHSFLNCKKELPQYGYKVGKISMKEQTVAFEKLG